MGTFCLPSLREGALLLFIMLSVAGDMDLPPEQLQQYADIHLSGINEICFQAVAVPSNDNLDKVIHALESEDYADRAAAERALTLIAPIVRRRLSFLSVNHRDPHVRYVLRRILFLTRNKNPQSSLPARLVAVRLLRMRPGERGQVLIQAMLDKTPAVRWAALDELIRLKGEAAVSDVIKFINDNRDSLSIRPMFLVRTYKRLAAVEIKEQSRRDLLAAFLKNEISHVGSCSEPLLVVSGLIEALNSCGSRADVMSAIAKALDDSRPGLSRGKAGVSAFVLDFFAALDTAAFGNVDEKNGRGVIRKWLNDTKRSSNTVNALKAEEWSGALSVLLDGIRRDILLREQRGIMPFLPPGTSFILCLDVEMIRNSALKSELLKGLHDAPDGRLADTMKLLCEIFGGYDIGRLYFAVTDDFPLEKALFSKFVREGVLDLERLESVLKRNGYGFLIITGDFDSADMIKRLKTAMPEGPLAIKGGAGGNMRVQYGVCALGGSAMGIVFGKEGNNVIISLQKAWKQGDVLIPGELQSLLQRSPLRHDECAFAVAHNPGRQLLFLSPPVKPFQKIRSLRMSVTLGKTVKMRLECGTRSAAEAVLCAGAFAYVARAGKSIEKESPKKGALARLYENVSIKVEGKNIVIENDIMPERWGGIFRTIVEALLKQERRSKGKSGLSERGVSRKILPGDQR